MSWAKSWGCGDGGDPGLRRDGGEGVKSAVLAGVLAGLLVASPGAGWAEGLVIGQRIEQTRTVDLAAIQQSPAVTEAISFLTGHGEEKGTYKGAPLWVVLEKEGVVGAGAPRARVGQEVVITGRDGYAAVLGMGEIDPAFEGKQVLLAYEEGGKVIPLRLVVPGDKHGGRAVKDVVRVEVASSPGALRARTPDRGPGQASPARQER
jgi:DMSO/TMAO reductase YedYZ molybdopterin-dependent catalytic subunit